MSSKRQLTEEEWFACLDPRTMLSRLTPLARRELTYRVLTEYACACCSRVQHLLPEGPCLEALKLAKESATSAINPETVAAVRREIERTWPDPTAEVNTSHAAAYAAYFAIFDDNSCQEFQRTHGWTGAPSYQTLLAFFKDTSATYAADAMALSRATPQSPRDRANLARRAKFFDRERAKQASILRDVLGNPFHGRDA